MSAPRVYQWSSLWTNLTIYCSDILDKLHRRAASIIEGNKVSQPQVAQVFSWSSLQSRRNYLKCMLVFKCLQTWLHPICLRNFHHSREFHDYNTRHRDLLRPPFAKTPKATFTRDQSGTVPNRTGPDRLLFSWNCLEPVQVFTRAFWNRSGSDPILDLQNSRSSFGSVPDRFQNGPV